MGCAYAKNKMESEYHIHIGKTGESDVLVSFIDEYGDNTELIWIWDPVERYVFREDLSTINQIYSKLHIEGDTRTKRSQLVELFLPNP